jgi:hypothetical protein
MFFHPDRPGLLLRLRTARLRRSCGDVGLVRSPHSGRNEKEIAQVPTGWLEIAMKESNVICGAGTPFTNRRGVPKHRDLSGAATRQL